MSPPTTEERVLAVIARSYDLPPGVAPDRLRLSSLPAWNSLEHMNLVLEIENEFDIRFPGYAIPELTSVAAIVRQIDEQAGGG